MNLTLHGALADLDKLSNETSKSPEAFLLELETMLEDADIEINEVYEMVRDYNATERVPCKR